MENVMTRAWEIAKAAVIKFGGKAVEYIAGAMKMAWVEIKKGVFKMEFIKKEELARDYKNGVLILSNSTRQPAWVAEVTGLDEKYEFARNFEEETEQGAGWLGFELTESGIYNWKESSEQKFGIVENGKLYEISKKDALNIFA